MKLPKIGINPFIFVDKERSYEKTRFFISTFGTVALQLP